MVFTEISALVQSQWQLLRSAFDAEGHERRVQQRQEKKQAKQQRKAARRAAREARRAQRKQRHTLLSPTVVGERTDDEERPETSSNSNTPATTTEEAGGLAWARTAEALTDDASSEYVAVGEKHAVAEATTLVIAKTVIATPLPMELALEMEAQLEQKQREFYDSLGGYSTVDEEDDELHELLAVGHRVSDAKLPTKWTVVGLKKTPALTSEKEVFFKVPEEMEDTGVKAEVSPATSTTSSSKKPRQKSLSRSSELVETEPEDDEVDLRDSEVFGGYSTFDDDEESRDLYIADSAFDGLCAPPSSFPMTQTSAKTIEALESKVSPTEVEVKVEGKEEVVVDKIIAIDINDKLPEVPKQLESKHSPMTHIYFSDEEMLDTANVEDKLCEEESDETDAEEELEIMETLNEVPEVVTNEMSETLEVVEGEEAVQHPADEDMFGQQTSLPASPTQSLKQSSSSTPGLYSPGSVDEYAGSIYESLRAREHRYHVTDDIFAEQHGVRPKMRAVLVDWLVEVHQRFELEAQTLFLTVNYIDRYLAQAPVKSQRFQLVGVAALLIASKFEEIYPCDMDDLLYICERSYTKTDLIDCERDLLNVFKFNLAVPSVSSFLGYYLTYFEEEDQLICQLASYFAESYCYIENQAPSLVWNSRLVELTGYTVEEISPAKEFGEVAHLPLEDLEMLLC
ncbi:Cyclin-like protein [Phytophthora palmivora]|uniref:Cyclin-like protein n=1 Tax=Phytophthora palmivora TaxID=4796 RepID=A0A2P4Y0P2_9STRA|nr:Cyclin-like protein [Phytophthora palmivora]